jgi:hypothetical protein
MEASEIDVEYTRELVGEKDKEEDENEDVDEEEENSSRGACFGERKKKSAGTERGGRECLLISLRPKHTSTHRPLTPPDAPHLHHHPHHPALHSFLYIHLSICYRY